MRRVWFAVAINLVIPGGGLIVLRREWLGFAISILFVVLTQIAIFGLLIVPLDLPRWAVVVALVGMAGVWVLSQWLVLVRGRLVASPELERELRDLRGRAREALARGDYAEANRALLVAISVAPAFAGKADIGPPYGVHKAPAFDNANSCMVCHGDRIGPPYGVHKAPAIDKAKSCMVCHGACGD